MVSHLVFQLGKSLETAPTSDSPESDLGETGQRFVGKCNSMLLGPASGHRDVTTLGRV
jgi:hypothetical protein